MSASTWYASKGTGTKVAVQSGLFVASFKASTILCKKLGLVGVFLVLLATVALTVYSVARWLAPKVRQLWASYSSHRATQGGTR